MTETTAEYQAETAATTIPTEQRAETTPASIPGICYLLQVNGDPTFRLTKEAARKNSPNAVYTAAGWLFQTKEEAEEVAKRYRRGKRKLDVVRWFHEHVDAIWHGSKTKKVLAQKAISNEINKFKANQQIEAIYAACYERGLHWSSLHFDPSESLPEHLTGKDKETYDYYRPIFLKALEAKEDAALAEQDLQQEVNDADVKNLEKAFEAADGANTLAKNYPAGREVIVRGIPKTITNMEKLDSRFALLEAPGQPCVIINRRDAQPISNNDFTKRLCGEVVVVGLDKDEKPVYVDADKFWTGNTRKKVYRHIAFTNKEVSKDTYNLYTGLGVQPKKGCCQRILNHIEEVVCAGDEKANTAFLKLLAWQIQNIGHPSRVIVALKSKEQQVGKGSLLEHVLVPIYGPSAFQTSDMDKVTGRFNDTLRGKSLVFLDEAFFSGDHKAADAMKSLATASRLAVEAKGVPTVQLPVAFNFFLTSNHDHIAYVEEADARYWILEVSPHRRGDVEYFRALYEEINNGGREAFLHLLLNLDVKEFVPARDVPKDNAAKDEMIRQSINPYDARKWLEECCHSEMILGLKPTDPQCKIQWEPWVQGDEFFNGVLTTAYTEWQKTVKSPMRPKPTPVNKLGELLNKAGFEQRVMGHRRRTLPDVNECLKVVTKMMEKSGK